MPKPTTLFGPFAPEHKLHPAFVAVRSFPGSEPTRLMMEEAFTSFTDADGNFIEQFQTSGFDARVFELFLHAFFNDAGLSVERPTDRPDFLVARGGLTAAIEATTSNPRRLRPVESPTDALAAALDQDVRELPHRPGRDDILAQLSAEERRERILRSEHEFPIKLGSALYSKLKNRYWDLPVVQGKPFVIAVEAFHADDSLNFSSSGLADYLYGIQQTWHHDAKGKLHVVNLPRDVHRFGTKEIPSNFFAQPDTEHVSAVMFTNSGTVAKFSRMGYQAGMHRGNLIIGRAGYFMDPDPNSTSPVAVSYRLDEPPFQEKWAHGVTVFHNPSARVPLPRDFFFGATQVYMLDEKLVADGSVHSPYLSRTLTLAFNNDAFTPVDLAASGVGTILVREFDALKPMRSPYAHMTGKEVAWISNKERTVLGVVVMDRQDRDYAYIVLRPDLRGRFRFAEIGPWYRQQEGPLKQVVQRIAQLTAKGETVYPQGDEDSDDSPGESVRLPSLVRRKRRKKRRGR